MRKIFTMLFVLCAAHLSAQEASSEKSYFTEGYELRIERMTLGTIISDDLSSEDDGEITFSHGISVNFGRQHDKHLYYGLGVELRNRLDMSDIIYFSLPVYAEFRSYFPIKKTAPYVGMKLGYSINLKGMKSERYDLYQRHDGKWFHKDYNYEDKEKGIYVEPAIGIRIKQVVDLGLSLPIVQFVRETEAYDSQTRRTEEYKKRDLSMSLNVTIAFHIKL
jgi:hypothetical protein